MDNRSSRRRPTSFWRVAITVSITAWLAIHQVPAKRVEADELVCVTVGDKRYIGDPLFVSGNQILLLLRDGRLRELPGTNSVRLEKVSDQYQPYSHQEIRTRLTREFGSNFEISMTRHYVVVHPIGQGDRWTVQFEELYSHFVHYFGTRGWRLDEPRAPLVAIVLHDRAEFFEYARSRSDAIDPNVVGYYSSHTNRITLYDATSTAGQNGALDNLSTIYHEAAHQAAFNTGVHARFTPAPRWAAEGLGTLFETPAVWSANTFASRDGRVNRRMKDEFLQQVGSQPSAIDLQRLIDSDDWFNVDSRGAYARAWALSYYLSETRPYEYVEYLKRTANKGPFQRVSQEERWADWNAVFKDDLRSMELHMMRFLTQP